MSEVRKGKYYAVIADAVTDVANKEQLCLHYVHDDHVKEMFLDFVEVERITGQVLAGTILQCLTACDLSLAYM